MVVNQVNISSGYSFSQSLIFRTEEIAQHSRFCGDENPLHLDPVFAKTTRFGGVIVSGPHVMSLFTGMVASHFSKISPMVGLEFSFKFIKPVYPDVETHMTWTVVSTREKGANKNIFVSLKGSVSDGANDLLEGIGLIMLTNKL